MRYKVIGLMRQYRNKFSSNADHTRRIKKDVTSRNQTHAPEKRRGRMPCVYSFRPAELDSKIRILNTTAIDYYVIVVT